MAENMVYNTGKNKEAKLETVNHRVLEMTRNPNTKRTIHTQTDKY